MIEVKYNFTCSDKYIKTNMIHDLLHLVNKSQQQAEGHLYWWDKDATICVTVGIIL